MRYKELIMAVKCGGTEPSEIDQEQCKVCRFSETQKGIIPVTHHGRRREVAVLVCDRDRVDAEVIEALELLEALGDDGR